MHVGEIMYGIYFLNISKEKYVRLLFFLRVAAQKPFAYLARAAQENTEIHKST